jgi:hypothetical protein
MRFLATCTIVFCLLLACEGQLLGPNGEPTTEQNVVIEANALMESWKSQIAALEARTDLTPTEQGELAKRKAQLAFAEGEMNNIVTTEGGIDAGAAVTSGAMLLPPPWNIPASIFLGGAVEWFRSRKKRKSFQNLVEAINKAKVKNATFGIALDGVGPELRADMGEAAAREVDRVRKGKLNIIRDW